MNVVLSNANPGWGGWATMVLDLARGLRARGHAVRVLCRPDSALHRALGTEIPHDPLAHGMNLSPRSVARIARSLRRQGAEVLLGGTSRDLRMAVPAARLAGVPAVMHRASIATFKARPDHRWLLDRLPVHHVANSRATRETMLASAPWLPPERVSMIYNGIDPAPFRRAIPAELRLPAGAVAVGFVGRLVDEKGLPELAAAWKRIAAAEPRAHLLVAGTGPHERALRQQLADTPRVHWLGFRRDVPALMRAFDLLVVPSWKEPFGLVAVEAMAAGTPVVATRSGGLAEVPRDGVDGLLVPARDPSALVDAVLRLIRDGGLRARMAAAAPARARDFGSATMVAEYAVLLERVAAGEAAHPVFSTAPPTAAALRAPGERAPRRRPPSRPG